MMIFLIVSGVLAALFLIYAFVLVFPGVKGERMKRFSHFLTDYAHRGLWGDGVPENSLTAFERAAQHGFGIELDVRPSKDGMIYVFHDNNLKRMTGVDKNFIDMTSQEIDALRLLGTGECVPKFAEVLSTVDGRVPLMVELKGDDFNTAVCVGADKLLSTYKGDYCIESFNPALVNWYRKNRPEIMRGQLVDSRNKLLSRLMSTLCFNFINRPDFISHKYNSFNRLSVFLSTRLWGTARTVWTVKSDEVRRQEIEKGANVIFEGFVPSDR